MLAGRETSAARLDRIGQRTERRLGSLPVNASIGDTDTLLAALQTSGGLLVTLADVGLDHHSNDAVLTLTKLVLNGLEHLGLVTVVLRGVSWLRVPSVLEIPKFWVAPGR